jgi:DNA-binding transcriptional ArsR family regulator
MPTDAQHGEADVAAVAGLLGEPARAAIIGALMDGSTHRASDLARRAGVAASTASGHLSRLLEGGLVVSETRGRERHYRLASDATAEAIEALARLAPPAAVRSLRAGSRGEALRRARTCYDHLAGRLGVALTETLVEVEALVPGDASFTLTPSGEKLLERIGVDVGGARKRRRSFARACLDWSERRPHLAGALGAALADALLAQDWVRRRPNDRALVVTVAGERRLRRLGVALAE